MKRKTIQGPVQKILIIKLRAIGDVVLSTAVIPNLKKIYQSAAIHFAVEPAGKEVITGNESIDRVVVLPAKKTKQSFSLKRMIESIRFVQNLRKEKYDLVFDLFGNPRSAFLTWMTGAKYRVGFDFRGRKYAYNIRVQPRGDRVHEVDFNLDALRELNIPIVHRFPQFPVPVEAEEKINRWIATQQIRESFLIGIHPWGSWEAKRWGLTHFAELADRLSEAYRATVIVLWGPGEQHHAKKVCSLARTSPALAPETTLKELGALLSRCDLVIANDSGPMHISAAVGTKTIGIFGPTSWRLQGPFGPRNDVAYKKGLTCLGCNRLTCDELICMKTLSVDDVMEVVQRVVSMKTYSGSKQHELRQA